MNTLQSASVPAYRSLLRLLVGVSLGTILITGCAGMGPAPVPTTGALPRSAMADQGVLPPAIPGIPTLPELVTVVPFFWKPQETVQEQTKVVIPAEVDGWHGIFILDTGSPPFMLNRTFLQPSPTGGVDTVTAADRRPDPTEENTPATFEKVHVTVRIGTLHVAFADPTLNGPAGSGPYNASLGHEWGNFGWNFAPRLGNIGLAVLEPFETIIDYPHRRVVLIRLDTAGHRLAAVPAYPPQRTVPLIDIDRGADGGIFWGIAVRPDGILDTRDPTQNTEVHLLDTGTPDDTTGEILGYSFLRQYGVIGFNHRTHQFILYRTFSLPPEPPRRYP